MTQNRDSIVDIEHRLVDGLLVQEHLVDEIHSLQASNSTIKRVIAALVLAITLSLVATGVAFHASMEAGRAVDQVKLVQDENRASALEHCRTRNAAPRAVRESLTAAYDALERIVEPDYKSEIARLRAAITPANVTDVDCNSDGVIDAADYRQ